MPKVRRKSKRPAMIAIQTATKRKNSVRKAKERVRRTARVATRAAALKKAGA